MRHSSRPSITAKLAATRGSTSPQPSKGGGLSNPIPGRRARDPFVGMKNLAYAGLAGTLMSTAFGVAAPSAQAATRDGVCDAEEFCVYFNSNQQGSVSDFTGSISNYGSTQPGCYEFKGAGAGQGRCVKNSAASVWNRASGPVTVYFNSGYAGASQAVAPAARVNLNATLKNENASHRFGPNSPVPPAPAPVPTPQPVPPAPAPAPVSNAADRAASWAERQASWAERRAERRVGAIECSGRQKQWVRNYGPNLGCRIAWCGIFVFNAYKIGAGAQIKGSYADTMWIYNNAKAKKNGLREVSRAQARRGDLVLMHYEEGAPGNVNHVGIARGPMRNNIIRTVEGNVFHTVGMRNRSFTRENGNKIILVARVTVP